MMDALKTLNTTIRYRFVNGDVESFQGKSCYRLANSWIDAVDKARRECRDRGETFSRSRIESATEWNHEDIVNQSGL